MLSPMAQGTASNARLAARELGQVKDVLDPTIESGTPGYRQVLSDYATASAPIDTQRYLQGLNLTDSFGNVTLGRVDGGLKRIAADQAKPGPVGAKSIPDDVMDGLQALRDDLRRQTNSSLGKPIGSNTFQNLATSGALSSLGPLGGVASIATSCRSSICSAKGCGDPTLRRMGRSSICWPHGWQTRCWECQICRPAIGSRRP